MRSQLLVALLCSTVLTACGVRESEGKRHVKLASGREVILVTVGPMRFQDGSTSVMVKYETPTDISNVVALRAEALELWSVLSVDVEKAGYSSAILSANTPSTGALFENGRGYNFVLERGNNGVWRQP